MIVIGMMYLSTDIDAFEMYLKLDNGTFSSVKNAPRSVYLSWNSIIYY